MIETNPTDIETAAKLERSQGFDSCTNYAEHFRHEFQLKKQTSDYMLGKKQHPWVTPFSKALGYKNIPAFNDPAHLPESFSMNRFADELCRTMGTTMVGTSQGRIDQILLTVPPVLTNGATNTDIPVSPIDERHLKTLLIQMDSHTHFTFLCQVHQLARIESWLDELKISADRASAFLCTSQYSVWAQDSYIPLVDHHDNSILCKPSFFPRCEDSLVADRICRQADTRTVQSSLQFTGGNILQTNEYTLVGVDWVIKNFHGGSLSELQEVLHRFKGICGREVLPVGRKLPVSSLVRKHLPGGKYQALFNLDMFVTPTGINSANGKEIIMVGRPSKSNKILNRKPGPYEFDRLFEQVQVQLEKCFKVVELPLHFQTKLLSKRVRAYHLSYNNVLIENFITESGATKRIVYMPIYGSNDPSLYDDIPARKTLDDAAAEIWKNVGFEVRRLDPMEDLAIGLGSIGCVAKALKRSHRCQQI
jgi:hypothetical protein